MSVKSVISIAAIATVTSLGASIASAQITIPTVPVGNPGNAADPATGGLYGSVAYSYNIGTTEVTNAQYAAFLNAKAASDPHSLYNGNGVSTGMAGSFGGITRSGSPGSYTYATVSGRANNPVSFVSFWDATRFANWLHNGQGSGDTETGAYTLGGVTNPVNASITRNGGATWALPTENEWYKAAYHQPASQGGPASSYWLYPTQSNTITTAQANYSSSSIGNTTPVGSYAANFYGAFDMGGNVWEWNEAVPSGSFRGLRGGSLAYDTGILRATFRNFNSAPIEFNDVGFRVAQIPGPSAVPLMAIVGAVAARRRR